MGRVTPAELIIVLVIILLLFGARKLPDLARSLGASAKEFRKGLSQGAEEADDEKADKVEAVEKAERVEKVDRPPDA